MINVSDFLTVTLKVNACCLFAESGQIFDTPVRAFCPFGSSGAELCDYMFQDEKMEEVLDRIKELTDDSVSAEMLQIDCERPASQ